MESSSNHHHRTDYDSSRHHVTPPAGGGFRIHVDFRPSAFRQKRRCDFLGGHLNRICTDWLEVVKVNLNNGRTVFQVSLLADDPQPLSFMLSEVICRAGSVQY